MRKALRTILTAISVILLFSMNATAQALSNPASPMMKKADSLYFARNWAEAKTIYLKLLADTSHNSIAWNRLGFSDYNTGDYDGAMIGYQKALANNPIIQVKASAY